jgi:hypothetical protein
LGSVAAEIPRAAKAVTTAATNATWGPLPDGPLRSAQRLAGLVNAIVSSTLHANTNCVILRLPASDTYLIV